MKPDAIELMLARRAGPGGAAQRAGLTARSLCPQPPLSSRFNEAGGSRPGLVLALKCAPRFIGDARIWLYLFNYLGIQGSQDHATEAVAMAQLLRPSRRYQPGLC